MEYRGRKVTVERNEGFTAPNNWELKIDGEPAGPFLFRDPTSARQEAIRIIKQIDEAVKARARRAAKKAEAMKGGV